MSKRLSLFALGTFLWALSVPAHAQQPPKLRRIGFLTSTPLSAVSERIDALRQGLRDLGYVEGKNIFIELRAGDGKIDRMDELAAELVRLKANVIVTAGPQGTRHAKKATSTIPIVMGFDNDPVGSGFVASLAQPGGNITGLSVLSPELSGKQLELLKEVIPKLSRVTVIGNSNDPGYAKMLEETKRAAAVLGVHHLNIDVRTAEDIETAFRSATRERADAVLALQSFLLTSQRKQLVGLAVKNRLPAIYDRREFVADGGLMTYGVSSTDLFRRAAGYVDKIFKGAKPADLPVEQPTKFEFIVNLKAAKQIGLTIPPNVLARADRVIR